jgi:hypothetical protein
MTIEGKADLERRLAESKVRADLVVLVSAGPVLDADGSALDSELLDLAERGDAQMVVCAGPGPSGVSHRGISVVFARPPSAAPDRFFDPYDVRVIRWSGEKLTAERERIVRDNWTDLGQSARELSLGGARSFHDRFPLLFWLSAGVAALLGVLPWVSRRSAK